ncbi:MAG: radical SAM protein, partial [Clostridiales bacterium]|nr:radical SAM protein [Clostridiales bacterium]
MWEEPCISGEKGSGTVFFAGCNLHCRFCQNYDISVKPHGVEISVNRLADIMLYLQDTGAANVNLVTPSHFSDKVAEALEKTRHKLRIPVVYNTSSYDKADAIRRLKGLVDVYLPDLKFFDVRVSRRYAGVSDYFET